MKKNYSLTTLLSLLILFLTLIVLIGCLNKQQSSKTENQKSQVKIGTMESASDFQSKCITIDPKVAYEIIKKNSGNKNFVIIDVRQPNEYNEGHIRNAILINYYSKNFKEEIAKLDRNKTYVIYCRSGSRSGRTLKLMKQLQFKRVYNIYGGIMNWKREKLPVVK